MEEYINEQAAELKQLAETSTPSVHVLIGTLSVLLHVAVQPLTTVDSRYRLSKMIGDLIKIWIIETTVTFIVDEMGSFLLY